MTTTGKIDQAETRAVHYFDAHHRFIAAFLVALAAFFAWPGNHPLFARLVLGWDVFAFTSLLLSWIVITRGDPYEARIYARLQDSSRRFLFIVAILAASASLAAVLVLLGSAKNLSSTVFISHLLLAVAAIVLSWSMVHTLFALRYAHYYYLDAREVERGDVVGGLLFPGDDQPDYLDFAYFSFVIGMTCQVSDVQITAKKIRRLALLHGTISFAFNTAILALFINIIAGLI